MLISPQEKSKAFGTIVGACLQGKIIAAAMPTAIKGIEKITHVVAESRVGQSVAQSVEKLAQGAARIGAAEEVIAVTAEGIPVHVATAAQETMSFQNAAQKVGSAVGALTNKEIARQIEKNTPEILAAIRESLEDLVKNGTKIKEIYDYNKIKISHIFSEKHIEGGILAIGKTESEIINEFIKVIKKVDTLNQLKEGTTNIMTYMNNIPIELRPFMKGNILMGFDAFVGHSSRGLLDCVRA